MFSSIVGIRGYPKGQTEDGFELHFGTNHLGHFALFQALKDALIASSKPLLGYAQSKTANIYMALEIERRYGAKGVRGLAVHPGGISGTRLNRMTPETQLNALISDPKIARKMKSAEQGAATTVWAAVAAEWAERGGVYLEDCQESEPWNGDETVLAPGYALHIHDAESASRLWEISLEMIGSVV